MLYSLLNKNCSNRFNDITESNKPEMYSGIKKRGSPNELKIYKEVKILLMLISDEKIALDNIDIKLVILLVDADNPLTNRFKSCIFLR